MSTWDVGVLSLLLNRLQSLAPSRLRYFNRAVGKLNREAIITSCLHRFVLNKGMRNNINDGLIIDHLHCDMICNCINNSALSTPMTALFSYRIMMKILSSQSGLCIITWFILDKVNYTRALAHLIIVCVSFWACTCVSCVLAKEGRYCRLPGMRYWNKNGINHTPSGYGS